MLLEYSKNIVGDNIKWSELQGFVAGSMRALDPHWASVRASVQQSFCRLQICFHSNESSANRVSDVTRFRETIEGFQSRTAVQKQCKFSWKVRRDTSFSQWNYYRIKRVVADRRVLLSIFEHSENHQGCAWIILMLINHINKIQRINRPHLIKESICP